MLCHDADISPAIQVPQGVEATMRVQTDGRILYFLLNHNEMSVSIMLPPGTFTSILTGKKVEKELEIIARDIVVLLI